MSNVPSADLHDQWDEIARNQKFWARGGRLEGNNWGEEQFLRAGRDEIVKLLDTLNQIAPDAGRDDTLDFGCGVGRMTLPLSECFGHVTGVDISEVMIEKATQRLQGVDNVTLKARGDLSFMESDSVDLAHEFVVFQHAGPELMSGYLKEFFRILRPGGIRRLHAPVASSTDPVGSSAYGPAGRRDQPAQAAA